MDAYNLAIVFSPNLVKSANVLRDVQMCAIPGPTLWAPDPSAASSPQKENKSTVGTVIKCCIERYFEVFDEVQDRSEAVAPTTTNSVHTSRHFTEEPGPFLPSDDDIDDVTQVPGEPAPSVKHSSRLPPSAWGSPKDGTDLPYQPRHRRIASGGGTSHHGMAASPTQSPSLVGLGVRSMATGGTPTPFPSIGRSRSVIHVEKDSGPLTATGIRKGSIRLGSGTSKGTVGKSAGAAVEALSVTASGFFAAPTKSNGNGTL